MSFDAHSFQTQLARQLKAFDREAATTAVTALTEQLYHDDLRLPPDAGARVLELLRDSRMFSLMGRMADALLLTGNGSFKIRKLYIQSLIDEGHFVAALEAIAGLERDTRDDPAGSDEYTEVLGLKGRAYKQLAVRSGGRQTKWGAAFVRQALAAYGAGYSLAPDKNVWHGINLVALLHMAGTDDPVASAYRDPKEIAERVLAVIDARCIDKQADAWDFATAGEACIALNRPEEALEWFSGYVRMPYIAAFHIAGTLRQLKEIWQLDESSGSGQLLIPLLQAELLQRAGGDLELTREQLLQQQTTADSTAARYQQVRRKETDTSAHADKGPLLEKVFGYDSFHSYRWYMQGAARCLAVARLGREPGEGLGTGFLLSGGLLHEKLGDEPVLLTNAHVLSDNRADGSPIRLQYAHISFEVLDGQKYFRPQEIIWSSPKGELDVTILRFTPADQAELKRLTEKLEPYSVSEELPPLPIDQPSPHRLYIIGHPNGGILRLSLQDNMLLDHEAPRIHYRTPTAPGNSGSPIFNSNWELVGIHHAGYEYMNKLNGMKGTYEANEGIWIRSIREALATAVKEGTVTLP